MFRRLLLGATIFFIMPLSLFAQERYVIAYSGTGGFQASIWAMKDMGVLEKYGLKATFPMNAIAVRRSFLENNREVVKRFLKAHTDAVYQFKRDKKRGIQVLQKRLQQKDTAVIEGTYDYYAPKFAFPPRVNREGLELTAKFVMDRIAGGKTGIDASKTLDESIVDELEREGFFKQLAK